jgi:hypothetical protein
MFAVHLTALVMDPDSSRYLVAGRSVGLPAPPFIGLELMLTEIVRPKLVEVGYDVPIAEWWAADEDVTIHSARHDGIARETLEEHAEWLREAGYTVEIRPFGTEPPRRAHLRLVPKDGGAG